METFINFISEQKPKDFKAPRKQRASKKSSEDRAATEYNCQLCDARVWNSGLGGQCSRKKIDGEWCCTIHSKEAAKNDGKLRNGLITEERPTHAYGDESQALLPWHDVDIPKKMKETKNSLVYSSYHFKPETTEIKKPPVEFMNTYIPENGEHAVKSILYIIKKYYPDLILC